MAHFRIPSSLTCCAIAVSLGLGACSGGGGGSESSSGNQGVDTTPPAAERVALEMDNNNALEVGDYGVSVVEKMLQLGGLAAALMTDTIEAPDAERADSCSNGGLVDFEFTDVDGNQRPSTSDTIKAMYRDCFLSQLNKTVAGDIVITVLENAESDGVTSYALRIDVADMEMADNQGTILTLEESFDVSYIDSALQNVLTVGGDTVLVYDDGATQLSDALEGFSFERTIHRDTARYSITAEGLVSSQVLQGQFEIVANTGVSGYMGTFPEQGELDFVGAENVSISMAANLVTNSSSAEVTLNDGAGSVSVTLVPWDQSVDGFLWSSTNLATDATIEQFDANRFVLLDSNVIDTVNEIAEELSDVSVIDPFTFQFSREINSQTFPNAFSLSLLDDGGNVESTVAVDVQLDGAFLRLQPQMQLLHGRTYEGPVIAVSGVSEIVDLFDNAFSWASENRFTTATNLQSVIESNQTDVVISGDVFTLSGASSLSSKADIASYSWRQLSGPVGALEESDVVSTIFTAPVVADTHSGLETVTVELTVTDNNGETNTAVKTIDFYRAFADSIEAFVISVNDAAVLSSTAIDFDSRIIPNSDLLVSENHPFFSSEHRVYGYATNDPNASAEDTIAAIDTAHIDGAFSFADRGVGAEDYLPLQVGSYSAMNDVNGEPFLSVFMGAECLGDGSFDVLEIDYGDSSGDLKSVAIDFAHSCGTTNPNAITGSLRYRSDIPIP